MWYLRYAIKSGMSTAKIIELTGIDPWFLDNLLEIVETEKMLRDRNERAGSSSTATGAEDRPAR